MCSSLIPSLTDNDIEEHLFSYATIGARVRKVSTKSPQTKSFRVDVNEQYYNRIYNPANLNKGIRVTKLINSSYGVKTNVL